MGKKVQIKIKPPKTGATRKFGGETFLYHHRTFTKTQANRDAASLRLNRVGNVRVTKGKTDHPVKRHQYNLWIDFGARKMPKRR